MVRELVSLYQKVYQTPKVTPRYSALLFSSRMYIMREAAADREFSSWKFQNPQSLELLRWAARHTADQFLADNPNWVPRGQFRWYLESLDIDDEYINLKPHCFVTVRLDRSMTIESAYKKIKELRYTWLQGSELVIEDFGTDNPHFHLLIPKKIHKGNIIKQLANRFKVPKPSVDYTQSDEPDRWEQHYNYIRGRKKAEKMPKVEADIAYRNAHSIPHLITF